MSKKDSNRIAISYIVNCDDDILMGFREKEQKWTTPSGHIHKGEDPHCGMLRELKEETGLDAVCIDLCHVEFNKDKNLMLYLFKITVDADQEVDFSKDPDKEFSEVKYKDPNDVKEELHVTAEENIAIQYWLKS